VGRHARVHRDIGYSDVTGLASFATFAGTTQDVIHTRQAYATANWQLTPRWLAYGGVNATERKHDDPARTSTTSRPSRGGRA